MKNHLVYFVIAIIGLFLGATITSRVSKTPVEHPVLAEIKTEKARKTKPAPEPEAKVETKISATPSVQQLVELAASPIPSGSKPAPPHSTLETQQEEERAQRVSALESLDQLATKGVSIEKQLKYILSTQTDPIVLFLAEVSLKGVLQNRPGKLTRFIDESFAEFERKTRGP